ncbi:class I SAM-dependent methyltransferase [Phenylobacterium sp. 58.2.17]|uniref:class I SAM-dependent methyltransferase n=1 Tax=Phenylobacterium sp. 58.2.17 TaxID=2969306 RepID=UPI002264BFE2|nr:class I SAM-dependent methyltransferase [Phenylobacterium sp. 58.2.17]MCX7586513.1 class I SAM-dependent methyltransferase [Phenylobacterium sp. 58.2.17]
MSTRSHWDTVYGTKAATEVSWFEPSADLSLALIARAGVAFDAPIIDIGGGLSPLADGLAAAGYGDVTVLDVSAEAIRLRLARQASEVPIRGIAADLLTWRPDRSYQVWHDRAVLHFLTEASDQARYRRTLMDALVPGGQAIIATFAPSGPERCSGLPVRRYGPEDLQALMGPDFTMVESFEFDHLTPGGQTQRFHVARLERSQ